MSTLFVHSTAMAKRLKRATDHLYKRGDTWWVYYRSGGKRVRKSLGTKREEEAIRILDGYRLGGPPVEIGEDIEVSIADYIADQTKTRFTPSTSRSTKYALHRIAKQARVWMLACAKPKLPQEIYNLFASTSEVTARTYSMRWHAFQVWLYRRERIQQMPDPVEFAKRQLPRRNVVVSWEMAREIIRLVPKQKNLPAKAASKGDTLFVLYCAFFAGMRRSEIVMARPSWFDLAARVIKIPGEEKTTVNGITRVWRTKSSLARSIPIHARFARFLRVFLKDKKTFCLHEEATGKIYRWDARRPFEASLERHRQRFPGRLPDGVSMHTARHSFISNLANAGKHSIAQISLWSGDQVRTLESNYFHARPRGDELDGF